MTEIESSLGKTSSGSSSENKILTVDDPTQDPFSINSKRDSDYQRSSQELLELERQKDIIANKRNISLEAKERIEFLIGLGRIKDSVTVENIEFTFQSLNGEEQNEIFDSLSKFNEITAIKMQYEVRFQTLARALTHIQGKEFASVIESEDIKDKIAMIKAMDENISDHLYKWYQKNIVTLGREKYAVTTSEDVQEVSDAIKK